MGTLDACRGYRPLLHIRYQPVLQQNSLSYAGVMMSLLHPRNTHYTPGCYQPTVDVGPAR